jgi:catechol 2,3-dioxygenase-like lactoylglutathione lyase family enzyme
MRLCLLLIAASLSAQELPIAGISHVNFRVSDLEASRAFYTGVLGYPEAFAMKQPDGTLRTISLKVNETQFIELSPSLKPDESKRLTHVSLVTSDMAALHRMLTERGLNPTALRPAGPDGTLGIRIADPDGNPIEFTQYLPASMHAQSRGKFLDPHRVSTHILHAGAGTKHPEAALVFYKEKLGFVQVWPIAPGNGVARQWNLRMPGANGDYVELMILPESTTRAQLGGLQHLCLEVPDIQAAYKIIVERGAKASKPAVGKTRRWLFNVYDPDGSRIEFIEPKLAQTALSSPAPR